MPRKVSPNSTTSLHEINTVSGLFSGDPDCQYLEPSEATLKRVRLLEIEAMQDGMSSDLYGILEDEDIELLRTR